MNETAINEDRTEHLLDYFPINESEVGLLLSLKESPSFFSSPTLDRIFQRAKQIVYTSSDDVDAQLLEAVVSLCGRRDERIIWRLLEQEEDHCYVQEFIDHYFSKTKRTSTLVNRDQQTDYHAWIKKALPQLPSLVSVIYAKEVGLQPKSAALATHLDGIDLPLWGSKPRVPVQLSLMNLDGPWRPIYRSDFDGLSFHTFSSALISFLGPTITLIQTTSNELIGYYTAVPWKTARTWYTGEGEAFFFRLEPEWNIYLPQYFGSSVPKKYHQYLHLPHLNAARKMDLEGLAVGGVAPNLPRLHINPSLERCKANPIGSVFESGPLLSDGQVFFDVQALEVWSMSGDYDDGHAAGQKQADIRESLRQKVARVDRSEFVDHLAQHSTLFSHRQHNRPDTSNGTDLCDVGERCS